MKSSIFMEISLFRFESMNGDSQNFTHFNMHDNLSESFFFSSLQFADR